MIDFAAAQEMVLRHLEQTERRMNDFGSALPGHADKPRRHLVVWSTDEHDFGWVFHWCTREFLETEDFRYALGGNAPLIVDRHDGKMYSTGTAYALEHYLNRYRRGDRGNAISAT